MNRFFTKNYLLRVLLLLAANWMSPYDGFSYALEERFPRFPFQIWRIIQDGSFLVLSFIAGVIRGNPWAVIGAGTVCMVLFTGPFITFFRKHFADPMFAKLKE